VAAFRATLEEVVEAELMLHVMDASAEDVLEREAAVNAVLGEIGAGDRPRLLVLNKADRTPPARLQSLQAARPGSVVVSALTGEGLDGLRDAITSRLLLEPRNVRLRFRADDARGIAGVYGAGRVLAHEVVGQEVTLDVEIPERFLERYREHLA